MLFARGPWWRGAASDCGVNENGMRVMKKMNESNKEEDGSRRLFLCRIDKQPARERESGDEGRLKMSHTSYPN